MSLLKITRSICPVCHKIIGASVIEEDGKVWLEKSCKEHGTFREIYWADAEMYKRAEKYAKEGKGVSNPAIILPDPSKVACPYNCGLCSAHTSHTVLGNIFATNRCNLRCHYCFANAGAEGVIYEPPFEKIKFMLETLRNNLPVPTEAVQFTGGEPSLREDMLDIIAMAKSMGFRHIQFNTNGVKFALEPDLPKKYRNAGVNVVYLSFDGVTQKTNIKNHKYIPKIIQNCRSAGLPITLVPTIINTVNDHEIGEIVMFGLENIDIVRSVNFQPISFVGKKEIPAKKESSGKSAKNGIGRRKAEAEELRREKLRQKERITIPEVLKKLEAQTGGIIPVSAFYPIPCVGPVSKLASKIAGNVPVVDFTVEPHCGMATYVFKDGNKIIPISDFVDVDGFFALLNSLSAENIYNPVGKAKALSMLYLRLNKIVDKSKMPANFDMNAALIDILTKDYNALERFHIESLMIGIMHFQDPYNFDAERVKRCVIHYAVPDGRIIPFCAFNALPEIYREKLNKDFGIPIKEWEKQTGRKLADDLKIR